MSWRAPAAGPLVLLADAGGRGAAPKLGYRPNPIDERIRERVWRERP